VGSHGFSTWIHELGHALGLEHPGNYNGGSPQYGNGSTGWLFAEDSEQYTIMSYFDESNTGADFGTDWVTWAPYGWGVSAQTPMVYDILAIQQMYGADYTTRAGDTVYGFNSNVAGPIYDFTVNHNPALTIWDGDGTDTIDLSGYSPTPPCRWWPAAIRRSMAERTTLPSRLMWTSKTALAGQAMTR
jgi:serralysin